MAADRRFVTAPGPSLHATAIAVAERGVLIRGASGAGKSRLALLLLHEAGRQVLFARLVGDDRVAVAACHGRLVARPHPATVGLIERRFEGIVHVPHEPACVLHGVIDLDDRPRPRLPEPADASVTLFDVALPRIVLPAGLDGVDADAVLARLLRRDGSQADG